LHLAGRDVVRDREVVEIKAKKLRGKEMHGESLRGIAREESGQAIRLERGSYLGRERGDEEARFRKRALREPEQVRGLATDTRCRELAARRKDRVISSGAEAQSRLVRAYVGAKSSDPQIVDSRFAR
jgi:hypothetical protein